MKRISILSALFFLSVIMLYTSYESYLEYSLIEAGNKLNKKGSYMEADKVYKKAVEGYASEEGRKNRAINLYMGKEYDRVIEESSKETFIRGNSYVYAAERMQDNKRTEYYEKALEEYKKAMKDSEDINIKKNYEITAAKLRERRQEQEEKKKNEQERNQNKEQKQQDKKKTGEDRENNGEQKEGQNENQIKDGGSENRSENEGSQQEQPENREENSMKEGWGKAKPRSSKGKEIQKKGNEETQKREAYTILQRLEGDEDQAFKNNERLKNIGGERGEVSW